MHNFVILCWEPEKNQQENNPETWQTSDPQDLLPHFEQRPSLWLCLGQ